MGWKSQEERTRDTKLIGQLMKNLIGAHVTRQLDDHIESHKEMWRLYMQLPKPQAEPQETPEERERLMALLAEVTKGSAK